MALVKVAAGTAGPDAIDPSLSWLNPLAIDSSTRWSAGVLVAVFIYWGWDSTVTVNEESRDSQRGPGEGGAVMATVILLLIYVIVSIAALAYGGPQQLIDNSDDVLCVLGRGGLRLAAGQDPR